MQILNTISNFFISTAYADSGAAAQQQGGGLSLMMMLGVFVLFMYFMVWRPQSKRAKDHRSLIQSLNKGDEVVTAGGILGKVAKVTDHYIKVALADNVEIAVQKSSVVNVLPKGTIKTIE